MEPKPMSPEGESKTEIRLCTEDDLAALEAAISSPHHEKRFQDQQEGKSNYLVAWRNGVPVGHLNLKWDGDEQPEVRAHIKDCPELNAISVWPPEMRSHGIGRKLIDEAEAMAKARGFNQVGLGVEVTNPRAKELYERLGYQDWGHGTYHDKWVGKDDSGQDVEHNDPCYYLVKAL